MRGGRTRVFALLGEPVAHSLSPAMQNAAFRVLEEAGLEIRSPAARDYYRRAGALVDEGTERVRMGREPAEGHGLGMRLPVEMLEGGARKMGAGGGHLVVEFGEEGFGDGHLFSVR